ncbi:MAG: VOC family protein, partial [Solirubrobacteraceae bacterium]
MSAAEGAASEQPFGVQGLAHVGVILPELQSAASLFAKLGLEVSGPEDEPDLGLEVLWVKAGATVLECIAPTGSESRAAAAIERGEAGVHHVALQVRGLDALLASLAEQGVAIRDTTPRQGAHGTRISFLDPAASGGALVELIEE